jgi:flagellar FliJ protein
MTQLAQSGTFNLLAKITAIALQKLGRKVLSARHNLSVVEEKRDVLRDFKKDYLNRAEADSRVGIKNEQYQNYQYFLTSLDQSIFRQNDTVSFYRNELETLSLQLNTLQQKKMLYEKIIFKQRVRHLAKLNKIEQKLTDSYANVRQHNNNNGLSP